MKSPHALKRFKMARTIDIRPTFPPKFKPFFEPNPWKIIWGGRGGGKSVSIAKYLLLEGVRRPLRILCAREFMSSIQDSVWQLLCDEIHELHLDDFYEIEKSGIRSKQPIDGKTTQFRFQGIKTNASQIKSFANIDICWVEEASNVSDRSWEILIPTIHRRGQTLDKPEIIVSMNPDFETDSSYQRFIVNPPSGACVIKMNWDDNPWFPPALQEAMEELKLRDFDKYKHVYEGECRRYLEGAIYKEQIREAEESHRFAQVPYDPLGGPVETFWDIGLNDATAIWIAQRVGREVHLIDYFEDSQKPIDYYLMILNDKTDHPYPIERIYLPHDARARELGTGRSIEEIIRAKGHRVSIVPRLTIADGLNAVRMIFPSLYFDVKKCSAGIACLRNYRYEVAEQGMGGLKNAPVHDRYSHGADALRYLAISLRPKREPTPSSNLNMHDFEHSGSTNGWMANI